MRGIDCMNHTDESSKVLRTRKSAPWSKNCSSEIKLKNVFRKRHHNSMVTGMRLIQQEGGPKAVIPGLYLGLCEGGYK